MASLTLTLSNRTISPVHEHAAIEACWERCCQSFYRYFSVRTGGDEHAVDDLMQQLWLQARLKSASLRAADAEPWLWRIAQNLMREHWRRGGGEKRMLADPALAASLAERLDTEALPDELLARQEVREQILLALTALPSTDQELLIGRYFEGRSQAELAAASGLSERAVEGRLYRAREALREKLAHLRPEESVT